MTYLACIVIGFVAGFLVHRKHAAKAASVESKSKALLDALKGKQ